MHTKNNFAMNLVRYTDLKIILLDYQNNYVEISSTISCAKCFDILAIS